ncbi:MAG: hypothetical protein JWN41_59 [Thermoleophilia bacterium]|nr:hypothetical protein [Thermoleophilia bacterium]
MSALLVSHKALAHMLGSSQNLERFTEAAARLGVTWTPLGQVDDAGVAFTEAQRVLRTLGDAHAADSRLATYFGTAHPSTTESLQSVATRLGQPRGLVDQAVRDHKLHALWTPARSGGYTPVVTEQLLDTLAGGQAAHGSQMVHTAAPVATTKSSTPSGLTRGKLLGAGVTVIAGGGAAVAIRGASADKSPEFKPSDIGAASAANQLIDMQLASATVPNDADPAAADAAAPGAEAKQPAESGSSQADPESAPAGEKSQASASKNDADGAEQKHDEKKPTRESKKPLEPTANDTRAALAEALKFPEGSPERKRMDVVIRALKEADNPPVDIKVDGTLDERVTAYIGATKDAIVDIKRAWSGDFTAWALKDTAAVGYAGSGVNDIATFQEWAGYAGAAKAKADYTPLPGDVVVLDRWSDRDGADSLGIVVAYDPATKDLTTVEGGVPTANDKTRAQVRRQTRNIGDAAVVGFVDAINAKRIDAKPPPPDPNAPNPAFFGNTTVPVRGAMSTTHPGGRPEQIKMIGRVIKWGLDNGMPDKVVLAAVSTIIVESGAYNNPEELDHDSLGLFQQRATWGSRDERLNPEISASKFYGNAKNYSDSHPNASVGDIAYAVQRCAKQYAYRYQETAGEAFAWLNAYRNG